MDNATVTELQAGTDAAESRWIQIAEQLLEQPTAPYRESLPQGMIRSFCRGRPALKLEEDLSGNLLVKYSAGDVKFPPLVLVAHLDHPGFWVDEVSGGETKLTFKGGVSAPHARLGSRIQFFEHGNPRPVGHGMLSSITQEKERLTGATAHVNEGYAVANGFAMWDFAGFALCNGLIVSRCCDDLLGASAALAVLDELATVKPDGVAVWGLFTRAEEVGFLGALEAIRHQLIPKDASILSLECSKALPSAPQGEGVIVRVGDRASIFDPHLTAALCVAAESVKKKVPGFKYQRKLMDGGACEATAFCAYGYRASGLAVPLGNYHNQGVDTNFKATIGPESVRQSDFNCEVRLLIELALQPSLLDRNANFNPDWLAERAKTAENELGNTRTRPAPSSPTDMYGKLSGS